MKTRLLHTGTGSTLLLFFCGWGTTPAAVAHLASEPDTTVMACYDYTGLSDLPDCSPYAAIRIVAWSMGVWAAGRVLAQHPALPVVSAVAVNGTPYPVSDTLGIPEPIFHGTLEGLSAETFTRFKRRMCGGGAAWNRYRQTVRPERPVEMLRDELAFIEAQCMQAASTEPVWNGWTKAVLSTADRIFPFENMHRYWTSRACPVVRIDAPHYPFYRWNAWKQLTE